MREPLYSEKNENHKNHKIPYENYEIHENIKTPCEKLEIMSIIEFHSKSCKS